MGATYQVKRNCNFRLLDDTFTIEEVEDILKDIDAMVETEVETELFGAARTNVLLLQQIFLQAEKWHLDLDADLSALENRYDLHNMESGM